MCYLKYTSSVLIAFVLFLLAVAFGFFVQTLLYEWVTFGAPQSTAEYIGALLASTLTATLVMAVPIHYVVNIIYNEF